MAIESARLVPRDPVGVQEMDRGARAQGWVLLRESAETRTSPRHKVWLTPSKEMGLHWVEDSFLKVRYLEVRSERIEAATELVARLVEVYSLEELYLQAEAAQQAEPLARMARDDPELSRNAQLMLQAILPRGGASG